MNTLVTILLSLCSFLEAIKNYPNAGLYLDKYNCRLDSMITPENFKNFQTEVTNIWNGACSANRGIFILDPPDGQTYNCGKWPSSWNCTLQTLFTSPSSVGRNALDLYIQAVYNTSEYQENDCSFGSLSELQCGREDPWRHVPWYPKLKAPIRAVNIGGLFVLERWIVPDLLPWGNETGIVDQYTFSKLCDSLQICEIVEYHWKHFYTQHDFTEMYRAGLNSIRLPVGHWYFTEISHVPSEPYLLPSESIFKETHPITRIIRFAKEAGLYVILDLHTAPGSQNGFDNSGQQTNETQEDNWGESWIYNEDNVRYTVQTCQAIAKYINFIESAYHLDNIILLEVLNEPWEDIDMALIKAFYLEAIREIRAERPGMSILLHDSFRGLQWGTLLKDWPYSNIYMDTHSYQCFNPWDFASDSPKSDRNKMYSHELEACANKIPLHYQTCNAVPVLVGEFSLAIDDCMPYVNARFQDVGQCNHLSLRNNSRFWDEHMTSFAMRQISTFERELGWSFWTWKLSEYAEKNSQPSSWYWSFRLAHQKGYINLHNKTEQTICFTNPLDDYLDGGDAVDGTDDGGMDDIDMETLSLSSKNVLINSQNFVYFLVFVISFSITLFIMTYFGIPYCKRRSMGYVNISYVEVPPPISVNI